MAWDYHVGQRVVCVDGRKIFGRPCPLILRKIYIISAVSFERGNFDGVIGSFHVVSVHGVKSFYERGRQHPWFAASRFRPLVTRQTDISCFTAILNGHRISEDA
jgi:hypothetical protein